LEPLVELVFGAFEDDVFVDVFEVILVVDLLDVEVVVLKFVVDALEEAVSVEVVGDGALLEFGGVGVESLVVVDEFVDVEGFVLLGALVLLVVLEV